MSIDTMKSSLSKAAARRFPLGTESTGLPASVTIARIWPRPGVSISSASTVAGRSPSVSGKPRTRLCQRSWPSRPPIRATRPMSKAGVVNIGPPSRPSRPVTMFSRSVAKVATVAYTPTHTPTREEHTAALARGTPAAGDVRRGHDACVRDRRVAAEAQEVDGAIDVRYRNRDRRAIQLVGGHNARVGVLRARAEAVAGADRLRERAHREERAVVVAGGVAPVEADRVAAVLLPDLAEAPGHEIEGLVPGDLLEAARCVAAHRPAQPVRVVVDGGDGDSLRADVTLGEDVILVGAHRQNSIALDLELEPADRLAERAGVKDRVRHRSLRSLSRYLPTTSAGT